LLSCSKPFISNGLTSLLAPKKQYIAVAKVFTSVEKLQSLNESVALIALLMKVAGFDPELVRLKLKRLISRYCYQNH